VCAGCVELDVAAMDVQKSLERMWCAATFMPHNGSDPGPLLRVPRRFVGGTPLSERCAMEQLRKRSWFQFSAQTCARLREPRERGERTGRSLDKRHTSV